MENLNIKNLGLTLGILTGVYFFLLALIAYLFSFGNLFVTTLSSVYIGYSATFLGSIIGLVYGFIEGFIFGALVALVYNALQK
ncbi:MAG: bacteriophage holin [Nanoarchaeota archaeon]|nr:bacteriophage holin [Nanoarchaeota archaeon]